MIDPIRNFLKQNLATGYSASATSITVPDGSKFPTVSTEGGFNLVWWNETDYPNPSDDPSVEIVRCTARTSNVLTITRAQEGTSASAKNAVGKTYAVMIAPTKALIDQIRTDTEAAQADADSALSQAAALDTRLDTAESDIDTLQTAATSLDTRLDAAESDIDTLQGQMSTVQGEVSTLTTTVAGKIPSTEKGATNGVATLDGSGKLTSSQLPNLAITDTFVVNTQSAMLALSAQVGDVAVRTDLNKTFILQAEPASTLGNWVEMLNPTAEVSSVFGRAGAITPQNGDYTASQVTNVPAGGIEATTVQGALNELDSDKENNITAGTTGQYWRGDKSWQALNKAAVGLSNVDNTSDTDKPISTLQQAGLDTKTDKTTVVSSDTTAANDKHYTVVASAVFTDPSPTEGKGYIVFVRNGTATVGGTGYSSGTLVVRTFHSGSWGTSIFLNTAGGDLSGTLDNAVVAGIQGVPVSPTPPTDGQVPAYDSDTGEYVPTTPAGGGSGTRRRVYSSLIENVTVSSRLQAGSGNSGSWALSSSGVTLATNNTINAFAFLSVTLGGFSNTTLSAVWANSPFSKNPIFEIVVSLSTALDDGTGSFGFGYTGNGASISHSNQALIFIDVVSGVLTATARTQGSGSQEDTNVTSAITWAASQTITLSIEFVSGASSLDSVKYYIDGNLIATHTDSTTLSYFTTNLALSNIRAYIRNGAIAANRSTVVSAISYSCDA